MSIATTICFLPATVISQQLKPNSETNRLFFPPSRFGCQNPLVSREPSYSWTKIIARRPNTMSSLSAGDDGFRAFEQEAFVDGSMKSSASEFEATLNNLSKWLVTALFGIILLWRHDAEALWAAIGSVLNTVLSTILKRTLNQERPVSNLRSDPGMPSSHAQAIFYTVTFTILSMVEWFGLNGITLPLSGLVFAFGSYLAWLRVTQQLHTVSQIVVGGLVGLFFSVLWFWSWEAFVFKAFSSHLWVRMAVTLGAAGFSLCFIVYIIRYWILDKQ